MKPVMNAHKFICTWCESPEEAYLFTLKQFSEQMFLCFVILEI